MNIKDEILDIKFEVDKVGSVTAKYVLNEYLIIFSIVENGDYDEILKTYSVIFEEENESTILVMDDVEPLDKLIAKCDDSLFSVSDYDSFTMDSPDDVVTLEELDHFIGSVLIGIEKPTITETNYVGNITSLPVPVRNLFCISALRSCRNMRRDKFYIESAYIVERPVTMGYELKVNYYTTNQDGEELISDSCFYILDESHDCSTFDHGVNRIARHCLRVANTTDYVKPDDRFYRDYELNLNRYLTHMEN